MVPEGHEPDPQPSERRREGWPRWSVWMLVALVLASVVIPSLLNRDSGTAIDYSNLIEEVTDGTIDSIVVTNGTGAIKAEAMDGTTYTSKGPVELPETDLELLRDRNVTVEFRTESSNPFLSLLPILLPFVLIIGLFWWMQRRAQGQMSGIMSIGRSKAKTYTTERPETGFDDIAGYKGVKQEITEVVDFLKGPDRFAAVGARIPKGVLLVGPPGTGKTLIARAVAGEAGVPFLSVTGSDFMEMFVGVGASRVRDLFQTARKLGRAIIFIDEIDSIGRKRGAGLGGGHDEREQTLN
ncbi:MAG: ATP-dependent metallopeptidase FtsH/Yme1/Tma family protein, partial [Actinomycetota bacterium]|nr:ATP-dependent metallopeptidase FtsH/Yme1/Tma family protein [Actinomycetota bacterium]